MAKAKSKRVYAKRRSQFHGDDTEGGPAEVYRWWRCETGPDCASQLWAWTDRHRTSWNSDALMDLVHEAIYRGRPLGQGQAQAGAQYLLLRSGVLLNLNIVMSMVDTATARLTKRRPMAQISATDAGYKQKTFAQQCSQVLRRKLGGTPVEKMSPRLIRDMCIRGDGVAKVERCYGDADIKRVPIYELIWDPFEVQAGNPRQMVHIRPEPREVMLGRYPHMAERIAEAPIYNRADPWAVYAYQAAITHDHVEVCEGWHLPSGPDTDDGQHVIALRGGNVICREPWTRQRFPITRAQWSAPTRGNGRGCGLVEQLAGIQEQINDILRDAREGLKHGSQLTVFMQRGANVNKHHLRGRHPKVVEFDGVEPHYVAPNPVSEQAIRILLMLIEQAYQIAGISQMAAQSKNVLGANASGKAMDTLDDIQSDRFAHVEADYQQMRVELGQLVVDEARSIAMDAKGKGEPAFDEQPPSPDKDDIAAWIRAVDWENVDIDGGDYHLTLEPVNFLSDNRAGRFAQVAELGKNGLIPDPSIQADLFDEPDIKRANRIMLGPKHRLDNIMMALGNPDIDLYQLQPDQYMNLALGALMAKGELNEAESMRKFDESTSDAELEVVCDRFRQWIALCEAEMKKSQAGSAAPSLPGMMPTSMGMAPNAMDLQPGLAAAPAPMGAAPMPPGMPPSGMPLQ